MPKMGPDETKVLQGGDYVRVLQTAKSHNNKNLDVVQDEILTFIAMEGEPGFAFCMNSFYKQGNVRINNLVLATRSLPALPTPPPHSPLPTLPTPPPLSPPPPPPPLPRPSQRTLFREKHSLYEDDLKKMEKMKTPLMCDNDGCPPVVMSKADQTPPSVFREAKSYPGNDSKEGRLPARPTDVSGACYSDKTPILYVDELKNINEFKASDYDDEDPYDGHPPYGHPPYGHPPVGESEGRSVVGEAKNDPGNDTKEGRLPARPTDVSGAYYSDKTPILYVDELKNINEFKASDYDDEDPYDGHPPYGHPPYGHPPVGESEGRSVVGEAKNDPGNDTKEGRLPARPTDVSGAYYSDKTPILYVDELKNINEFKASDYDDEDPYDGHPPYGHPPYGHPPVGESEGRSVVGEAKNDPGNDTKEGRLPARPTDVSGAYYSDKTPILYVDELKNINEFKASDYDDEDPYDGHPPYGHPPYGHPPVGESEGRSVVGEAKNDPGNDTKEGRLPARPTDVSGAYYSDKTPILYVDELKNINEFQASDYDYEDPDDGHPPVGKSKSRSVDRDAKSDPGNETKEGRLPARPPCKRGAYYYVKTPIMDDQFGGMRVDVGDIIKVLNSQSQGTIFAQCLQTLKKGYISMDFLRPTAPLDLKPWYFGEISCRDAEGLLWDQLNTFLVRESAKGLVISISGRKRTDPIRDPIRHRVIRRDGNLLYAWPGHNFHNIEDLITAHATQQWEMNIGQPYNKFSYGMAPESLPGLSSSAPTEDAASNIGTHGKVYMQKKEITPPIAKSNQGLQQWFIQEHKIKFGKELGAGCYGQVKIATLTDSNMTVAVKTFNAGTMNIEDVENEAIAMRDLRHPKLVRMFGLSEMNGNTQNIFIVMEYIENGSVKDYCKRHDTLPLGDAQKAIIAKNVVSGMKYLSSLDYIHRDLAARNVLLASDLSARIADFGLAKCIKSSRTSALDHRMPWKWSAPEVIGPYKDWTTKCDVWSFGVFCWELYTDCRRPYVAIKDIPALLKFLQEDGGRLEIEKTWPKPIQNVMKDCWIIPIEKRTDFKKIETVLENLN